jgi:hypothetical protein
LWKGCMKKSSCGVNREGVLRGLRRFMVVFICPYSWCDLGPHFQSLLLIMWVP